MKTIKQTYEQKVRERGFSLVAGIDEVGRGCWAGPIVAAGVIFAPDTHIEGLRDSKKLSSKQREYLAEEIKEKALAVSIHVLEAHDVDAFGVGRANAEVIRMVVDSLLPDFALIDFAHIKNIRVPYECIVKGDAKVFSISAASIVAKVHRDAIMIDYEKRYPGYGFAKHKGYGTQEHQAALTQKGICAIHRKSFKPISQMSLL